MSHPGGQAADPAGEALAHAFASGMLDPAGERVLFCGARDVTGLRRLRSGTWLCEQDLKPVADALMAAGWTTGHADDDARFATILLLPPRQRDHARAMLARALALLDASGTLVVAAANNDGARSLEADLARITGAVPRTLSKHKSRVFWYAGQAGAARDATLIAQWRGLEAITPIENGRYLSRRGLFAWDRVDAGSALLARSLPVDLQGQVADLGAGWGYLATQVLERCPAVTGIDLFEADARALEPARRNIEAAARGEVRACVTWHDVTVGVPGPYDVIVSNPPFHQGRADAPALGQAFIRAAADALRPDGSLWLVANRHLPYEATMSRHFGQQTLVADAQGYKVIHAEGVRR